MNCLDWKTFGVILWNGLMECSVNSTKEILTATDFNDTGAGYIGQWSRCNCKYWIYE